MKKKVNLPEATGPSGLRFGTDIEYFRVGSMCPTPDGSGPPKWVAIEIKVKGIKWPMFLRLLTAEAVDTVIAMLEKHKKDVWPTRLNKP